MLLVGARSEHLTQPVHTAPQSPPPSLHLERGGKEVTEGQASCFPVPPARQYGWERTTEREEQGMYPEGATD